MKSSPAKEALTPVRQHGMKRSLKISPPKEEVGPFSDEEAMDCTAPVVRPVAGWNWGVEKFPVVHVLGYGDIGGGEEQP